MSIKLDFTQHSIVVVCSDCPTWRALRFTRAEAWTAAANHELTLHPERLQARESLKWTLKKIRPHLVGALETPHTPAKLTP